MNRTATIVACCTLAGLSITGCASSTTRTNADAPQGSETVNLSLMDETPIASDRAVLHVEGLSCPACATNVDHQLKDVEGVRDVEVNLGDGTVDVLLGGSVRPSRATLARAIHDSGFTLKAIDVP